MSGMPGETEGLGMEAKVSRKGLGRTVSDLRQRAGET